MPGNRRRIHRNDDDVVGINRPAEVGIATLLAIVAVDPVEAFPAVVLLVECGLFAIVSVEVCHEFADAIVEPVSDERPVEFIVVVSLGPLSDFAPHEQKFFARS